MNDACRDFVFMTRDASWFEVMSLDMHPSFSIGVVPQTYYCVGIKSE